MVGIEGELERGTEWKSVLRNKAANMQAFRTHRPVSRATRASRDAAPVWVPKRGTLVTRSSTEDVQVVAQLEEDPTPRIHDMEWLHACDGDHCRPPLAAVAVCARPVVWIWPSGQLGECGKTFKLHCLHARDLVHTLTALPC